MNLSRKRIQNRCLYFASEMLGCNEEDLNLVEAEINQEFNNLGRITFKVRHIMKFHDYTYDLAWEYFYQLKPDFMENNCMHV